MSATNRGKTRETNDFYATPFWCVDRLIGSPDFLELHLACIEKPVEEQSWLEPCVGDGAIIDALAANDINPFAWDTVDVHPAEGLTFHGSFLDYQTREQYEFCISNPPYNLAQEVIDKARSLAVVTIMLLRVNFLGSEERHAWWTKMDRKPDIFVLPNRPVFTLNKQGKPGVDATEYAWFVWGPQSTGSWFMLDLTSKEERGEHSKKVVAEGIKPYVHEETCDLDADCTCMPTVDDLFLILDDAGKGRPQVLGELYHALIPDAPAHGALAGSGELGQKRVSTHEQLAAVVQGLE